MRIRPMENPFRDLDPGKKIAIGVGVGSVLAIATLATVAWASKSDPPPPKRAIEVEANCTSYAIASEQQLRDELRARVRSAAKKGPIDPLQVTAKYIRSVAPRCKTYPANTDTPVEAKLFADIYTELLEVMQQDDLLAPADFPVWYGMMATWVTAQGVSTEDL